MRVDITRRADLAVHATAVLGRATGRVKATELTALPNTTAGFVPQVLGPLVGAGWVRSDSGPTGGYLRVADSSMVTVLQVIEAVDGPIDGGRCVVASERACNSASPCTMHVAWGRARHELITALAATSLADVAPLIGCTNEPIWHRRPPPSASWSQRSAM